MRRFGCNVARFSLLLLTVALSQGCGRDPNVERAIELVKGREGILIGIAAMETVSPKASNVYANEELRWWASSRGDSKYLVTYRGFVEKESFELEFAVDVASGDVRAANLAADRVMGLATRFDTPDEPSGSAPSTPSPAPLPSARATPAPAIDVDFFAYYDEYADLARGSADYGSIDRLRPGDPVEFSFRISNKGSTPVPMRDLAVMVTPTELLDPTSTLREEWTADKQRDLLYPDKSQYYPLGKNYVYATLAGGRLNRGVRPGQDVEFKGYVLYRGQTIPVGSSTLHVMYPE
jgi:hypothetical protein